ncbi:hypothetical protein HHK36_019169 [Tetracentron sinense]|uniref:tRNA ligase phosphodiesterase domain-containing protein n=1 Tax=Tetracentron sinense TaxID=13715 RepID=A0A834Z1R9_TETSI|nr:hypothetical protein HHK36_019169 [Tetracentron sinense]
MSGSHRVLSVFALRISSSAPKPESFLLSRSPSLSSPARLALAHAIRFSSSVSDSSVPNPQGSAGTRERSLKENLKPDRPSLAMKGKSAATEAVTNRLSVLSIAENSEHAWPSVSPIQFVGVLENQVTVKGHKAVSKPKSYGTISGAETTSAEKSSAGLNKVFKGPLGEDFTVDNFTYSLAQIRATFYPKFENEKSDQEVAFFLCILLCYVTLLEPRIIETVSNGLATLEVAVAILSISLILVELFLLEPIADEDSIASSSVTRCFCGKSNLTHQTFQVSLKHSGSLFMYAGHEGGAYAKNSYGNIYTAVGVFVLGRMFREAWGTVAGKKQAEFNAFLEVICMSEIFNKSVVVTAVTELGNGKPKFYSTPDIIAFCREWRLPTNHVWLFSTRKSVASFFAAYDALCEEGTATPVCKALDEVADISIPGSKDHVKVQGEILEGLVARIVSHESSKHMEKVLADFPPPSDKASDHDLGPSLREICAANRSDEKQQIKALLQSVGTSFCPDYSDWFGNGAGDIHSRNADRSVLSKFLQSHPADFSTTKLQDMIRLMREKRFPAAFKCYYNFHKIASLSSDNLHLKMVIHVHSDSAFRRYQKEMRYKPGLWPLYRGFFVDINLFKVNKERAAEIAKDSDVLVKNTNGRCSTSGTDGLADEDANLMIKLKFLTYKLRTFLIRNGLSTLFKEGPAAYKAYYLRQMKIWGTSAGKQRELSKMLDEWAVYIRRKCGNKQLSSSIYLSEAEPFLEQYAKRSPENQALIGSAGNLVRAENFLAIVGGKDEEGDLDTERDVAPSSPSSTVRDTVLKNEGLIVFFPGIPGCAKSALCKEILSAPGGLGDDRPVHSLMGDLIKGVWYYHSSESSSRVGDEGDVSSPSTDTLDNKSESYFLYAKKDRVFFARVRKRFGILEEVRIDSEYTPLTLRSLELSTRVYLSQFEAGLRFPLTPLTIYCDNNVESTAITRRSGRSEAILSSAAPSSSSATPLSANARSFAREVCVQDIFEEMSQLPPRKALPLQAPARKVADECRKKPYAVMLADKNAPNEEVWRQIEDMCRSTRASAVPVVPDSEAGKQLVHKPDRDHSLFPRVRLLQKIHSQPSCLPGTDSYPFSLDALAVFMLRVLQRVNHPVTQFLILVSFLLLFVKGNLDKASPNAGYVLLIVVLYNVKHFLNLFSVVFVHIFQSRRDFESELVERFGSLIKMPLLNSDRSPLPDPVKSILEEGINLFKLHRSMHGRLESTKGSYAKDWIKWEKQLRDILSGNAEYLNSIQVSFDYAVKQVLEQLRAVAKGDYTTPSTEKRKFGTISFAAVTLPVAEIRSLLDKLAEKNPKVDDFLKDNDMKNCLKEAHVTLAHKRSHGVTAIASYGMFLQQKVPVDLSAFVFSEKMAALEAHLGSVGDEKINSKNQWPHVTIWTGEGVAAKEANMLPQLISEGKATRIDIDPPITISGTVDFY